MGFSSPASKSAQSESATSDFSNLIPVSDSPVSSGPSASSGPTRSAGGSPSGASRVDRKGAVDSVGNSAQISSDSSGEAKSARGLVADSTVASDSPLGDFTPLPRDPRLDDPVELAMEAAAIALAAALAQQPPQPVLPLVVADQSQLGTNAEQGGANFSQGDSFYAPVLPSSSAVVEAGSDQPALITDGLSVHLAGQAAGIPAKSALAEATVAAQSPSEQSARLASLPEAVRVVPKVVSTVVVEATLSQIAALTTPFAPVAQTHQGASDSGASVVSLVAQVVSNELATPVVEDASKGAGNSNVALPSVPTTDAANVSSGLAASDDAFLASADPQNPAAAFFAAKSDAGKPEPTTPAVSVDNGNPHASDLAALATGAPAVLQDERENGSGLGDPNRGDGDGSQNLAHRTSPEALAGGYLADAEGAEAERLNALGTLGAKVGDVEVVSSATSASADEDPARLTVSNDDSAWQQGSLADAVEFSGTQKVSLQSGTEQGVARETSSRPTVLPPIHARSVDLANVIQRVLERARSENPSHLAVEVRLEDGSSFGLEVRMNAAGLQASFRSESQPLLKALESNWSAFIARESAEQKIVSAAFEGRSGFGGFSDNNSDASERRERMEDNVSSALLGAFNPKDSAVVKSQDDTRSVPASAQRGMALYA